MKFFPLVTILATLTASTPLVLAHSTGPPSDVCLSMTPNHQANSQTSPPPFSLIATPTSVVAGQNVTVTLQSTDGQGFKGFLVQARNLADNKPIGDFILIDPSTTKYVDCSSIGSTARSTVSHNSPTPKLTLTFTWTVFPGLQADTFAKFFYTAVKERPTFWALVDSGAVVEIKAAAVAPVSSTPVPVTTTISSTTASPTISTISTTAFPISSSTASPVTSTTPSNGAVFPDASSSTGQNPDYAGCSTEKGCFGLPQGCLDSGTCTAMVAYKPLPDSNKFQLLLRSTGASSSSYVAFGLSDDGQMGADLVFACLGNNQVITTWNRVNGKDNAPGVLGVDVTDMTSRLDNGVLTCNFSVPAQMVVTTPDGNTLNIDLSVDKKFLLVSQGPFESSSPIRLAHHESKLASGSLVLLSAVGTVSGTDKVLLKAHGSLMIMAWMACAASGIIFARYMKETLKRVRILGKDVWFRAHQTFMVLCVALTIAALVCVATDRGSAPLSAAAVAENPHAAVGLACVILAFMQPIMAYFRPPPNDSNRWKFNWAHWLVGNAAWILGVVAIFFAADLSAADFIPTNPYYAQVAVYVFVVCFMHALLVVQRFWALKKNGEINDNVETTVRIGKRSGIAQFGVVDPKEGGEAQSGLKGETIRLRMVAFVILFAVFYSLILAIMVGLAAEGKLSWFNGPQADAGEAQVEVQAESHH